MFRWGNTCPTLWLDCTLGLSSNHNHRPRTSVRFPALSQPGENVWFSPQQDHHSPSRGERPFRTTSPHTEGRHHGSWDQQWTEALPLVLRIRTAYKEDLKSSAAELVYGSPLRIPGEPLVPAAPKVKSSDFMQQLRLLMDQLRPTTAARYSSPATIVHKDLRD